MTADTAVARRGRFTWWREVVAIAVGYAAYTFVRNGVTANEQEAVVRALNILRLEDALGLDVELALNRAVASVHWLATICNYFYATAHFAVTIAVGVWILRSHREYARGLRTAWYCMNLVALIGYWQYPLAPPRLLSELPYIDTVVVLNTWGSLASDSVQSVSNQYAAMPSMHFGWALWCGIVIYRLARRRWVRWLGIAYPLAVTTVIMATANHFFLDALGGGLALLAGFGLQRLIHGHGAFVAGREPRRLLPRRSHATA